MSGPFEQARNGLLRVAAQAEVISAKVIALQSDADTLLRKIREVYQGVDVPVELDSEARALAQQIDQVQVTATRITTEARTRAANLGRFR